MKTPSGLSLIAISALMLPALACRALGSGPGAGPFCAAIAEPDRGAVSDTQVFSALDLGSAKVVILNEAHFQSVNLAYADLIAKLKSASPRLDCLYMEYLPGFEPKTREAAGRDAVFGDLFTEAFDLGLKILYVDAEKRRTVEQESDHDSVERRNPLMAERIAQSIESGACRAGVYIVGKAHGYSSVEGRPVDPLRDFLTRRGLPTASLDLIDRYLARCPPDEQRCMVAFQRGKKFEEAPNASEWDYSSCLEGRGEFAYGTGFVNRRRGAHCAVAAERSGWGSVCDFDATLFY